jgi:hypothetical protein
MSAVLDREDMQGLIARGAGEEGRLEFVNGEAKLVECRIGLSKQLFGAKTQNLARQARHSVIDL